MVRRSSVRRMAAVRCAYRCVRAALVLSASTPQVTFALSHSVTERIVWFCRPLKSGAGRCLCHSPFTQTSVAELTPKHTGQHCRYEGVGWPDGGGHRIRPYPLQYAHAVDEKGALGSCCRASQGGSKRALLESQCGLYRQWSVSHAPLYLQVKKRRGPALHSAQGGPQQLVEPVPLS